MSPPYTSSEDEELISLFRQKNAMLNKPGGIEIYKDILQLSSMKRIRTPAGIKSHIQTILKQDYKTFNRNIGEEFNVSGKVTADDISTFIATAVAFEIKKLPGARVDLNVKENWELIFNSNKDVLQKYFPCAEKVMNFYVSNLNGSINHRIGGLLLHGFKAKVGMRDTVSLKETMEFKQQTRYRPDVSSRTQPFEASGSSDQTQPICGLDYELKEKMMQFRMTKGSLDETLQPISRSSTISVVKTDEILFESAKLSTPSQSPKQQQKGVVTPCSSFAFHDLNRGTSFEDGVQALSSEPMDVITLSDDEYNDAEGTTSDVSSQRYALNPNEEGPLVQSTSVSELPKTLNSSVVYDLDDASVSGGFLKCARETGFQNDLAATKEHEIVLSNARHSHLGLSSEPFNTNGMVKDIDAKNGANVNLGFSGEPNNANKIASDIQMKNGSSVNLGFSGEPNNTNGIASDIEMKNGANVTGKCSICSLADVEITEDKFYNPEMVRHMIIITTKAFERNPDLANAVLKFADAKILFCNDRCQELGIPENEYSTVDSKEGVIRFILWLGQLMKTEKKSFGRDFFNLHELLLLFEFICNKRYCKAKGLDEDQINALRAVPFP